MLPNIDKVAASSSPPGATATTQQKRSETDQLIQAVNARSAEAYKTQQPVSDQASATEKSFTTARVDKTDTKVKTDPRAKQDQVELNFSLSLEERDAFISAFSNKQDPATMTKEERDTLESAAERITKFVEETVAKNSERRERVEKAVSEWYSRITKRELEGPFDLVDLLRKAASGQLDKMWE